MAANVGPHATQVPWPVHIYKSPGCVATTIGYSLTSLIFYNIFSERLIVGTFPFDELKRGWAEFANAREAIMSRMPPDHVTDEDRIAWSTQVVTMYRRLLDSSVPPLKTSVYATLATPLASFLHGAVIWPLRRVVTWMSVQSPTEVATLAQNPIRIFKSMVEAEGSVLAALYGGFQIHAVHSLSQFVVSMLAGRIATYGLDYIHQQLNRFMDYQQRHNKLYNKRATSAAAVHESLLTAALGTMRIAVPAMCFFGTIGCLISARLISMPFALLSTMRILQNSPSIPKTSYMLRYGARMTDFELGREILIQQPLRAQLWRWVGYHWKWFMLSTATLPLGLNITADVELK